MPLANKLKGVQLNKKFKGPLWKGPTEEGITFSLLSRFLVCRERFRLLVVHGLRTAHQFEPRIEYGNLWHTCEEALAAGVDWQKPLLLYCQKLVAEYRNQQNEIDKWYNVCKTQFPLYVEYWSKHPHVKGREPLLQEETFKVPYNLPSGRTVVLLGKWDSVDIVNRKQAWLQENKSKSELDEATLRDQLQFDCQTMIYAVALKTSGILGKLPLAGVRYNGVRRPLSGGKGSIVRHKATEGSKCHKCKATGKFNDAQCPKCGGLKRLNAKPEESTTDFYNRLAAIIKEDSFDVKGNPKKDSTFFMRFDCQVSEKDIQRFEQRFLIPVLEQLCDWWIFMQRCNYDPWSINQQQATQAGYGIQTFKCGECEHLEYSLHWQHPFGVYNILNEGGRSDLDEYLANGSEVGLQRTTNLFPELDLVS